MTRHRSPRYRRTRRLLTLAVLLAAPIAAKAEIVNWGSVAGWTISVDRPSSSCGMVRKFSRETTMLVMFDRASKRFSLSLSNPLWDRRIQHDAEYALRIVMDGKAWDATFFGYAKGGTPLLNAPALKKEFLLDLMRRNRIQFYGKNDVLLTDLALDGSSAAMMELVECQNTMNASLEN